MRCSSIRRAASAASASARMLRGCACMRLAAVCVRKSVPASIRRRKSPSVKMPTTRFCASTTVVAPRPLALISRITSLKLACSGTAGAALPARITSATVVSRRRPSAPPGWERAKSSARKPRASSKATASASPSAICTVVLAVGARLRGQASFSTLLSSTTLACCARLDWGLPVMAISLMPWRLSTGSTRASSSLSPLLLMASTTSACVTMPRSPCPASAGCTKNAGVPVEASVAAILRPTWPLLPMPMTTTRPVARSMAATACSSCAAASGR